MFINLLVKYHEKAIYPQIFFVLALINKMYPDYALTMDAIYLPKVVKNKRAHYICIQKISCTTTPLYK